MHPEIRPPLADNTRLRELFWSPPDLSMLEEAARRIEQMLSHVEVAASPFDLFETPGAGAAAA
jgi:hypothetical protein